MPDHDEDQSNIPKSVLKQQRDADAAIGKLAEPAEPELEIPAPPAEPEPAPPATEPAQPAQPAQPAIDDTQNQGQWEHKYNVLQGKYNKEIPDLRDQIAELQVTIGTQSQQIEELTSKQSGPSTDADLSQLGDLNPEDFEGWGQEMKEMVVTINRQNAFIKGQAEVIKGLRGTAPADNNSEMSQRVESIENEIGKTRSSRYTEVLDTKIKGDWRKLNTDPKFISWANQTDPITMQPRMIHLRQAAQELRGDQVASIFNQYILGADKAIIPASSTFVDELPSGDGRGDGNFNQDQKPTVTAADLTKAQYEYTQGRITEEEYDKIYKTFQSELRRQRR